MLCSTSTVMSPDDSLMMNCSCIPVGLARSGNSRTTVPSAVTSTFDWWLWKSATIAASFGCADAPHAASSTARPQAKTRAIVSELTNLDVSCHRGVDRAVILDVARRVERDEELRSRAAQAGVKGRVVVRGDAVLGVVSDPIPLDRLTLGDRHRRRVKFADRVRVGGELDNLGCGPARGASLGRAGRGAAIITARTAACRQHQGAPGCHDCHPPNDHVCLLVDTVYPSTESTGRSRAGAVEWRPPIENQVLTVVTRVARRTLGAQSAPRGRSPPPI